MWVPLIESGEHLNEGADWFVEKYIRELLEISAKGPDIKNNRGIRMTENEKKKLIDQLEKQMKQAAAMLEFEIAAQYRDEIIRLKGKP